jgi:hypothetical protein
VLTTGSAESKLPTLVKPRSTWVITLKTSPMNPIEPLDQAYTHPWPTRGQRHGQTPLNRWRRRMSSGTFAVFSKFHLNTSKSTFMKVIHLVEGHNFRVYWHFKFWAEKGEKLGQPSVPPVFQNRPAFKVGTTFLQNPLRKTLYNLCKSCRGEWDQQLSYSPLCALLFNFSEKIPAKSVDGENPST